MNSLSLRSSSPPLPKPLSSALLPSNVSDQSPIISDQPPIFFLYEVLGQLKFKSQIKKVTLLKIPCWISKKTYSKETASEITKALQQLHTGPILPIKFGDISNQRTIVLAQTSRLRGGKLLSPLSPSIITAAEKYLMAKSRKKGNKLFAQVNINNFNAKTGLYEVEVKIKSGSSIRSHKYQETLSMIQHMANKTILDPASSSSSSSSSSASAIPPSSDTFSASSSGKESKISTELKS